MTIIHLKTKVERTARVLQLEGMFDLEPSKEAVTDIPLNFEDLNKKDWNIGLIVGPSGAGKSTVAKEMFGDILQRNEEMKWSEERAVIDDFPSVMSIRDITELLSSVGFSSPPAWLRPFKTLSNGEQFRVTMARILSENKDIAVVDEFTSVIDRTVAQIGSYAIAKTVRARKQKFVAVGCHYDIEEWLQPDWIYQPHIGQFTWGSVQPRPQVDLEIFQTNYNAWSAFARHHYLDASLNRSAQIFVATIKDQPAALIAVLPLVGKIPNAKRISRIVVLPDYQGIGVGGKFMSALSAGYKANGFRTYITTSHPAFIRSLNRSNQWLLNRAPSRSAQQNIGQMKDSSSRGRITAGFMYAGVTDKALATTLALPLAKV